MSKKVELKLLRRKFIQSGQEEKAHQVLKEYWNLGSHDKESVKESVVEKEVVEKIEIIEDEYKFNSIEELISIKGIGKETAKDIKKIYKNMSNLIIALKSGENLPLRNDVEKKLKRELI